MAITTWISAWLVFVFELAVIAIAGLAFLAVLFALFGATDTVMGLGTIAPFRVAETLLMRCRCS